MGKAIELAIKKTCMLQDVTAKLKILFKYRIMHLDKIIFKTVSRQNKTQTSPSGYSIEGGK